MLQRVALLLLVAFLAAYAADGSAWQRALDLHRSGDLKGAVDAYKEVLKDEPSRYDARSNLGAALSGLGRYEEAVEQYRLAIPAAPAQFGPKLQQNLALAYYKSGRFEEAAKTLEPLHAGSQDKNVDALLADCYLQSGEPAKAVAVLSVYEAGLDDKAIAYVLGTALIRAGEVARGRKVIDFILRDGDSAESRFLLGAAQFAAGDYPSAVKQLASAIALNPTVPGLQSMYGSALLSTGDPDGAAEAFRKELASNPNDYDANLRLGEVTFQRESAASALPLLRKAVSLRPKSFEARADLADALIAQHDLSEARALVIQLAAEYPNSPQLAAKLAAIERGPSAVNSKEPDSTGPKAGESAPGFLLPKLHSAETAALDTFRAGRPAVLLFGSYTCPNFRQQAPVINELAKRYNGQIPFLLVYIREAHGGENWQSTINERQRIDWKPAKTMPEMQEHAGSCVRKLNMDFPAVVDDPQGTVESKYGAWPSRLYILGRDGRVLYRTRLSEQDFHPSDVEAALRSALR
jgi:tetratricopeptide (TPR) repeat protein